MQTAAALDVHSQARIRPKREAQKILEMLLPDDGQNEIKLQRRGPDERLGGYE